MNAKHVELWERIGQFQLDSPDASFPFSARLAKENNWNPDYSHRVIAEYKRFAFLALAAGHPVSPSEDVDQAWHLHLTYSENYWKIFCREILGKPFHHQPSRGGRPRKGNSTIGMRAHSIATNNFSAKIRRRISGLIR